MTSADDIAYLRRRAAEERERAIHAAGSAATAHTALADAYERRLASLNATPLLLPEEHDPAVSAAMAT